MSGHRSKDVPKAPKPTNRDLPDRAKKRVLDDEPWLRAWSQQFDALLTWIARGTRLKMERLVVLGREEVMSDQCGWRKRTLLADFDASKI